MFYPAPYTNLFGPQVPTIYRRLGGGLGIDIGPVLLDIDPYSTAIIGATPPASAANTPWTWFSQGTAAVVERVDGTFNYYHEDEASDGVQSMYYLSPNDGTTKVRIEASMRALLSNGSSTNFVRIGIGLGSDSGDTLSFGWSKGPGFEPNEFISLFYKPLDNDRTGEVELQTKHIGSVSDAPTLILEYDPSTGVADCSISLNLGSSDNEIALFSDTQALSGTFDKIGILSMCSTSDAVWSDILHFDWSEVL